MEKNNLKPINLQKKYRRTSIDKESHKGNKENLEKVEDEPNIRESKERIEDGKGLITMYLSLDDLNDNEPITIPPPLTLKGNEPIVFFDLETTGLGDRPEIVQLSAVCGNKIFDKYIMPSKKMCPIASKVTKLYVRDNMMYHRRNPVKSYSLLQALLDFLEYLQQVSDEDRQPILAGHNILSYDVPILYRSLRQCNMAGEFKRHIAGCIDTRNIARQVIRAGEVRNYKQQTLVRRFLRVRYDAHNSLADVKSLQDLYYKKLVNHSDLLEFLFPFDTVYLKLTLQKMVDGKVISAQTQTKLALSGIGLQQLLLAHQKNSINGIQQLLSEPVTKNGETQPRITDSNRCINKIKTFIQNHASQFRK